MACISKDWLTISVKQTTPHFPAKSVLIKNEWYSLISRELTHNVFSRHWSIEKYVPGKDPIQVVVFSHEAKSKILPADIGHMKLINKFLYQDGEKIIELLQDLLEGFELKFHAVVRFDIALDFKKFYKGRSVQNFFKKVLRGEFLKEKCLSLDVWGKTTRGINAHYMRFGSKTSALQMYIYNKSKEMREKTFKPYIVDHWLDNGIKPGKEDTWRIEFSLHPNKFGVVDRRTGEMQGFDSLEVLQNTFVEKLFWCLFHQHFVFCQNDGQKRKERMKKVVLFKTGIRSTKYLRVVEKSTSNRVDKMHIKYMYQVERDWRNAGATMKEAIDNQVQKLGLERWVDEQLILEPIK